MNRERKTDPGQLKATAIWAGYMNESTDGVASLLLSNPDDLNNLTNEQLSSYTSGRVLDNLEGDTPQENSLDGLSDEQ